MTISKLISLLAENQSRYQNSIYFVPSESSLSPLARLPFILDAYSRYFFNDQRVSGKWAFNGGRELGTIEREILVPLLTDMTKSKFVNVRPISGMNCLTIAMAALTKLGDIVLSVPVSVGGHMSTPYIAQRLGIHLEYLPMATPYDIDLNRLEIILKEKQPALIYFDQSTLLFPLDPAPVRFLVDKCSPETIIHFDSSHLNGLILGKALFNPLEHGADTFGGSTHKTLPGPHKAFLATNRSNLAAKFDACADHFVSHPHMAEVISFAITLLELRDCGGEIYAHSVMENAKAFAKNLFEMGITVAAPERGFTGCHQVWITPETQSPWELGERLYRCGLMVNNFDSLPGISRHSMRLSLSEITKLGLTADEIGDLATTFKDALNMDFPEEQVSEQVKRLRRKFAQPRYCFQTIDLQDCELPEDIISFCRLLEKLLNSQPKL